MLMLFSPLTITIKKEHKIIKILKYNLYFFLYLMQNKDTLKGKKFTTMIQEPRHRQRS